MIKLIIAEDEKGLINFINTKNKKSLTVAMPSSNALTIASCGLNFDYDEIIEVKIGYTMNETIKGLNPCSFIDKSVFYCNDWKKEFAKIGIKPNKKEV